MSPLASCAYEGVVVHKRLAPKTHGFSYRVFALCLDLDEIDRLDGSLRLFSRGRRNLVSIRDADLAAPGPGRVGDKVRAQLRDAGLASACERIEMVCYPRLLGYVFNPLTVYFCRDSNARVGAVVYEVTNTFGERKSYVIPAHEGAAGAITQGCAKELYVSPFTRREGSYGFHALAPSERVVIGVNFREAGTPVLKTHFRGERRELSDAMLARLVLRYPLMTLKVIGAIHYEAARLWAKGVSLVPRHTSPPYSVSVIERPLREQSHA